MNQIRLVLVGIGAVLAMATLPGLTRASSFTWIVLDSSGTALEDLKAELATEADSKDLTLLTHISGLTVAITCTGSKLIGVNLEAEGKLAEGGRARFEGCEAYGKGSLEEALGCEINSAGAGAGVVETGQLKGELLRHELGDENFELLAKVEPKEGTTLVTILTEGCVLPEANALHGTLFVKDAEGMLKAHSIKHLVEQGPLTSLWMGTDTEEHLETSLDGSVWAVLNGAHKSLSWAAKHTVETLYEDAGLSWLVLNSKGTEAKELKAGLIADSDSSHLVFLSTIGGIMISMVCTSTELIGMNLETSGTLTTGGKIRLSGCRLYSGTFTGALSNVLTTTSLPCTIREGGEPAGTIVTEKLKGKLTLHEESAVLTEIVPESGTAFFFLHFEGSECSFPEEDPIRGVLRLRDGAGKALSHAVKHLLEEGPGTELTLGTAPVTLLGSIWVLLGGPHVGLSWAAMDS